MKVIEKRIAKEVKIVQAAEKVFFTQGYYQSRMEDVAKACGMSKPSLYFYFKSKEDLYMAITFKAFQMLIDRYYFTIDKFNDLNGADRVVKILESYLSYSEEHFQYHEALFDYMSLVRAPNGQETRLTSIYFKKIQGIHNLPIDIVVEEIKAGQQDGSITNNQKPEMIYLTAWALIAGYIKLNVFSGGVRLHHVPMDNWKSYIIKIARSLLK